MLNEGEHVPETIGQLHDGGEFSTAKLRGRPYVIYFYPKDFTPVCTKEACGFRDRKADLARVGAEVFGVSLDGAEQHKRFAESLQLNFPLIADPQKKLSEAFGVLRLWGLLPFTKRVTFVVDGDGRVSKVIASEFDADRHVDEALAALRALPRSSTTPR
jgi:thioredoxin-dependent peroxiredoxin